MYLKSLFSPREADFGCFLPEISPRALYAYLELALTFFSACNEKLIPSLTTISLHFDTQRHNPSFGLLN